MALLGILVLVVGFAARLNPLLVVTAAALAAGLASGHDPRAVLASLGKGFLDNRYIGAAWLVLPAIGLLERAGLRRQAARLLQRLRGASPGRVLLSYFIFRQATAALGLTSVCGQAQTVRPIIAPMAEAAAIHRTGGPLPTALLERVRAHAAAADNVAVFFGEDIFIAVASVLLIRGYMATQGYDIEPLHLSVWAMPTALAALLIHGSRLLLLDRAVPPAAEAAS